MAFKNNLKRRVEFRIIGRTFTTSAPKRYFKCDFEFEYKHFQFSNHLLSFSGDMIYYDPKNYSKTVKTYALSFKTTMFEESDPHAKCKNYPTEKYKNFKQCDDEFLKNFFEQQNV